MNSKFIYDVPTKVYFGEDQLDSLGQELGRFGKKVLVVYGGGSIKSSGLYNQISDIIKNCELEMFDCADIEPNPRVTSVIRGAEICKNNNVDVILAIGGGSVIDAAKYISAAAYYDGSPWDFVTGKAIIEKCLPIVTIVTLAATGSEMNSTAVLSKWDTNEKRGMVSPLFLPKVSFLDPTLTYTVNTYQTACGAADIMSHIMETYFNMQSDLYMLDTTMEGLMKTVIKYAPVALADPTNYDARANLMWASTWAINNFVLGGKKKVWSCHPMEHELSAYYDITHGLGLAIITPKWMEYVLDESNVSKFYQFGCNVFDLDKNKDQWEIAKESIACLSDFFFNTLGLQSSFSDINIDSTHFEKMSKSACKGNTINGFKTLNQQDIINIFTMCL